MMMMMMMMMMMVVVVVLVMALAMVMVKVVVMLLLLMVMMMMMIIIIIMMMMMIWRIYPSLNYTPTGSDNGLLPIQCQTIIRVNALLFFIGSLRTFSVKFESKYDDFH